MEHFVASTVDWLFDCIQFQIIGYALDIYDTKYYFIFISNMNGIYILQVSFGIWKLTQKGKIVGVIVGLALPSVRPFPFQAIDSPVLTVASGMW